MKKSADKPHILIIFCDQMQHQRMGFVDGISYTPALNGLAGEGVHFTHAITAHGQCVPARATLMTGQSPHECGVMLNYGFFGHQNMLTGKHNTLPKVLKRAGYDTAYFGKGHLGSPLDKLGFDKGFVSEKIEISDADRQRFGYADKPEYQYHWEDEKSLEGIMDLLGSRDLTEKPLFMVFSPNAPHPPMNNIEKYSDHFNPEEMKLPSSYYNEAFQEKPSFHEERANWAFDTGSDENKIKQNLANYYSMIAHMDNQIGQIIAEYKRLGIWDDTLVLFTSDHGDMMGGHRLIAKGTYPYDELYRIPCIFKLTSEMTFSRPVADDLVSSQAFAATLLKLAGVDIPESFTGGDFAEAFVREHHPDNEKVFFEHYAAHWGHHPFYGVRTRTLKYLRYYGEDNAEELYDLAKDPEELHNLTGNAAYVTQQKELAKMADNWWCSTSGRDVAYYESDDFINNQHNK